MAHMDAACIHGETLGGDCNLCPWPETVAEHPDDGSSGGCRDCGHIDGEDQRGRYMLAFFSEPSSGDVACPACYYLGTEPGREAVEREAARVRGALCPECGKPCWDLAGVDQALSKCWACGARWMPDGEDC